MMYSVLLILATKAGIVVSSSIERQSIKIREIVVYGGWLEVRKWFQEVAGLAPAILTKPRLGYKVFA